MIVVHTEQLIGAKMCVAQEGYVFCRELKNSDPLPFIFLN